jgi:glutathione S-transferase
VADGEHSRARRRRRGDHRAGVDHDRRVPRRAFTVADCAAAPALFYARVVHRWDEDALANLTRYFTALSARPSVARVIDEAREYRHLFPMPWPDYVQ